MRLDVLLTEKFAGAHTRSQIINAIKGGKVTVNGVVVTKSGTMVRDIDTVDANIEIESLNAVPEDIKLDIVYQDEHLMIINKPRGMVVHPGNGNRSGTLLNGLLYLTKNDETIDRGGIVHRLDKNTAGLMVVAKTAPVQAKLSAMLEKHEVKRTYIGIVEGRMDGEGTIDRNIIRDPNHRTLFKTTPTGGRRAITHFTVLQSFARHSLVQFRLETGRTHQIRVHCKAINHPIVGDPEYNPNSSIKANGQMLESVEIEFVHPVTGENIHKKINASDEFGLVLSKIS